MTCRWTEPIVLLLILVNVVVLTLQSVQGVYDHPRPTGGGYFHSWQDLVLFILFIAFSVEMVARILVSGLVFGPEERPHAKTLKGKATLVWDRLLDREKSQAGARSAIIAVPDLAYGTTSTNASSIAVNDFGQADKKASRRQDSQASFIYPPVSAQPTLRSYKSTSNLLSAKTPNSTLGTRRGLASSTFHEDVPFVQAFQTQQDQTLHHHKAFLRHSWNRVDALAVLSFWLMFFLALTGVESKQSVYIFRALSTLRAARLLTITAGTTVSHASDRLSNKLKFQFTCATRPS